MQINDTAAIIDRFNQAFLEHRPGLLDGLIGKTCVMESIQPAPNGTRYEGQDSCLAFWQALAADSLSQFELEETVVSGDRAVIRWRFHFGAGDSVRGVNLMQVSDDQASGLGRNGVWESANYQSASDSERITIQFNGGVGSLTVK